MTPLGRRKRRKTLNHLRSAGVPERLIKGMSEADLVEAYEEMQTQTQAQDIRQYLQSQRGDATQGSNEPATEQVDEPDIDALTANLDQSLGGDAAKAVREVLKLVGRSQSQELRAVQAQLQEMRAETIDSVADATRRELGKRFPELLDDDTYQQDIAPMVIQLANLDQYRGQGARAIPKLIEAAAKLNDLEEVEPGEPSPAKDTPTRTARRKGAGPPKPRKEAGSGLTRLSDEQLDTALVVAMQKNDMARKAKIDAEISRRARAAG